MRRNENGCDNIATYGTKRKRDFHRQVRVVYRACRRLYGKERTQDECLRVFKVVFPELYRLRNGASNYEQDKVRSQIAVIVQSWNPSKRLKELTDKVDSYLGIPMWSSDAELMQFYEDIMPVVMRIRKLTPRECFRLMGVSEPDIDKILNSGISNSACYKLAGNSIVKDVMTAIFDKLFVNTEQEKKAGTQLSLF